MTTFRVSKVESRWRIDYKNHYGNYWTDYADSFWQAIWWGFKEWIKP